MQTKKHNAKKKAPRKQKKHNANKKPNLNFTNRMSIMCTLMASFFVSTDF